MFISVANERSDNGVSGQIELSIARSRSELEDAFRLVHHSYVRAGLDAPNSLGMRLTKFHLLPTTQVMLAKKAGLPIATASLILDEQLGLPAEAIYGEEIDGLRRRGLRLGEVGSLADCRESVTRFIHMFRRLTTLIAQAGEFRGCNALIATTHPKHARFYIRQLGFEQFGEYRECPYVQGKPAVALVLDFEKQKGTPAHDHLFGQKYTAEELASYHWDEDTRQYFTSIFQQIHWQSGTSATLPGAAAFAPSSSITLLADGPLSG